jgi:hypothetical protein
MPQGNDLWNPYRWVPSSKESVAHAAPAHHHRWTGLAGRIDCRLTALTPFLINDGNHRFVRSRRTQKPSIPATSFKGLVRSLVELVGNSAHPFLRAPIDSDHVLDNASVEVNGQLHLDVAARMFGHLHSREVFAGLVRFSDGEWPADRPVPQPLSFKICGGTPDTDHRPFYPDRSRRKFYHHKTQATSLTPPHAGIPAGHIRTVYPLPPGVQFGFHVDFANLGDQELALLLYCLFLEEQVTVRLSPAALGPKYKESKTLTGPMRHKFGYAKPQGGGSVRIEAVRLGLQANPADRYRGRGTAPAVLEGEPLRAAITDRIAPIAARNDSTMQHLRAMMIYAEGDPRASNLNYPSYDWFQDDTYNQPGTPLKPTL